MLNLLGGFCVDGNTRILHRNGYDKIIDLVGKKVEVFNGIEWSEVTPTQTGVNQSLVRVVLSDGSYLDCTPYHEFSVRGCRQGNVWHKKKAQELSKGDILPTFRVPEDITGNSEPNAYSYGVFLGDGSREVRKDSNGVRYSVDLYPGKHHLPVVGSRGAMNKHGVITVSLGKHLDHRCMDTLKEDELPDWLFNLDRQSTIEFVKGWLDTDGCYHKGVGGVSISTSVESRARGLQLLLRRAGFSYVSIRKVHEEGDESNFGTRTSGLWLVYIPASEASMLNGHRVFTEYPQDLDKCVKQPRVVDVIPLEGRHNTYCFTEPKRNMGVFGNMLTYQCVIADVVPYHCETLEEAEDAVRTATRALIRVNTMPSVYSAEVARTNRIGVGLTGIHEFAYRFYGYSFRDLLDENHSADFWQALQRLSEAVQDEAETYSQQLGVTPPHTTVTIKPAGTTSKLFGLTEGCHLPAMGCYMRWVQFRNDDPIVDKYRKAGYPTQVLKTFKGMTVVGFPTKPEICNVIPEDKIVYAGDATPAEQYQFLRLLEKYWLRNERGNQISYTLKYKPEETPYEVFKQTILDNQHTVKCASVMPQEEVISAEYQPEQPISLEEYNEWMSVIQPIEEGEDIGREHLECGTGGCPIDIK